MEFNVEHIANMVAGNYTHQVRQIFGPEGTEALTRLLDAVRQIYAHCSPEQVGNPLTVVSAVSCNPHAPVLAQILNVNERLSAKEVARFILENTTEYECFLEVLGDNTFRVASAATGSTNFDGLKPTCVIYRYEAQKERILASDFDRIIQRLSPALSSNFAEPTFSRLEDAFRRYKNVAVETGCKILQDVWEGGVDGPRLVLKNKPESTMRDSLVQYLQTLLGEKANVRPEQNVDETKPVDIRIDWFGSDASALIEIKWIGRSTAKPRTPNGAKYTDYDESRAQSGAKQLSDYLDRDRLHTRAIRPMGYLVVYDARRENIQGARDYLSKEDGFFYRDKEIQFDPQYEESRDDFMSPVRFFLGPREVHLLA